MAGEVAKLHNWESGNDYPATETTGTPYTVVTDVVANGSQSVRVTLDSNQGENYQAGYRRCIFRETYNNSNADVMRAERYGDHYFYTLSFRPESGTWFPSGTLIWEIHGPNGDWPGGTSLVAPHAIQWRNGEWQYRRHTGKLQGAAFGGNIVNYSMSPAINSIGGNTWRDWIVEILYDDPGIVGVWTRLRGTDSDFVKVVDLPTAAGLCYVTSKTEDHRYYRLEGSYGPLPTPTSVITRFWLDNGGRHLTMNDARAVFGLSPVGGGSPVYFSDLWDDGTIGADWASYGTGTGWSATETGGVLACAGGSVTGQAGASTYLTTYSLVGSEIQARLVSNGYGVAQAIAYLAFRDDSSNAVEIRVKAGNLIAYKKVAGVETDVATVTYNANVHRFLRIRHDGTSLFWDYSTDGTSWTQLATATAPITITSGSLDLGVIATSPSGAVGTVTWDNFVFQAASSGSGAPPPAPNIFPILTGAADGGTRATGASDTAAGAATATYNDTNTTIYAARSNDGAGTFNIDTILLEFDASGIDDTVTKQAATLEIYVKLAGSADGLSLVGDWYTGAMSAAGHTRVISSSTAFSAIPLSGVSAGQLLSIPLTNLSNLSLTGVTRIRLGLSGSDPSGANYLGIASLEDDQQEARLTVTYIAGGSGPSTTYAFATSSNGYSGGSVHAGSGRTVANGTRDASRVGT